MLIVKIGVNYRQQPVTNHGGPGGHYGPLVGPHAEPVAPRDFPLARRGPEVWAA